MRRFFPVHGTTSHEERRPLWSRQGHCRGFMWVRPRSDVLIAALEVLHPGYFKALPPSPVETANRAEAVGLAEYDEFFRWG